MDSQNPDKEENAAPKSDREENAAPKWDDQPPKEIHNIEDLTPAQQAFVRELIDAFPKPLDLGPIPELPPLGESPKGYMDFPSQYFTLEEIEIAKKLCEDIVNIKRKPDGTDDDEKSPICDSCGDIHP